MPDSKKGKEKPYSENPKSSKREVDFARRQLLRAGWTVPVIMAVTPQNVFAISPVVHGDTGDDHQDSGGHTDTPGTTHDDTTVPHIDSGGHTDFAHADDFLPHSDTPHADTPLVPHGDDRHSDTNIFGTHLDTGVPHGDIPHDDVHSDIPHSDATIPHSDLAGFHSDLPGTTHDDTTVPHDDTPATPHADT